MATRDGRQRVVIERIAPAIDGGQFPIKRVVGESVAIEASVFVDGHDRLAAVVVFRHEDDREWSEVPLELLVNDRWRTRFTVTRVGRYQYTVKAWVDRFHTWRGDFRKRVAAGQDVAVDLLIGAALVDEAVERAGGEDREQLSRWGQRLRDAEAKAHLETICEDVDFGRLMDRHLPRLHASSCSPPLEIVVDRERARFSAWYELFPRSTSAEPGRHGTLRDCIDRLPYVASMGFDIVYLPPVHPVGRQFRKGRNNQTTASEGDVGSPWAIGGEEGGHKAILPELGTLDDFRDLVSAASKHGMEIALDVAFQCSPDHPYVKEHPEWFRARPDGTIQYAENPPKKYQDIYPFNFECENWRELWGELKSIFEFWIAQGVKVFRVDNPHTKPFAFWEWCIGELKQQHPELILLSEAFTRPKLMYRLAKLGFTQSYTYFAWRNTAHELTEYLTELTTTEVRDYFRPNLWPNTPDILTEHMQTGGRAAFISRFVLAATLGASYGIYGPAYEHCVNVPREPGSEEYLDSEKYEVKHWDVNRADGLKELIARVNRIRKEHAALHTNDLLTFHPVDNGHLLAYSKITADKSDVLLIVVNCDPHNTQAGFVTLPLEDLNLEDGHPFQVHDLLSDARYIWEGERNFVELNPHVMPAHIFRIRRRIRSERDFEYYV